MNETPNDDSWFFVDAARQQQGPVSAEDLQVRYARGELRADTLIWQTGMAEWQPLRLAMSLPEPVVRAAQDPLPANPAIMAPGTPINRTDIVYAGFWRRVAAYQLDSFILSIATYIVILPVMMVMGMGAQQAMLQQSDDPSAVLATMWPMMAVTYFLIFALQTVYFAWMHSRREQATLGKMAVGIKVARSDGSRISFARGIGRYFAMFLSALPLGIGFLMAAFTARKQALHDIICDTIVVDRWAYTDRPDLQKRGLDGVTIAILVILALMLLFFIGLGLMLGAALASGDWR